MNLTKSEEDYLKALFSIISETEANGAGTNQIADHLQISAASVNGMLKKLRAKQLVSYEKYGKVKLTSDGREIAIRLVRKHRLWETFLHDFMNFKWHEVHEVAEQLEHIKSPKLIDELDKFLGYPAMDPHGDPIPSSSGEFKANPKTTLADMKPGFNCKLLSVKDGSAAFLKYVTQIGLALSSRIAILEIREFDGSMRIRFDEKEENVTRQFAENIFVRKL